MLLISLAFAGTPTADKAAASLLREARAGRATETWLDVDAWTWGEVRPVVRALVDRVADPTRTGPVRALAGDPAARRRQAEVAIQPDVHATVECTLSGGADTVAASPVAPPETAPWWPDRGKLSRLSLVPLSCPSATPYVALALTETVGVGWRIAAFVAAPDLQAWRDLAQEASRDLVAERTAAREVVRAAVKEPIVARFDAPGLPTIPKVEADLDGDGHDETLLRFREIYWGGSGTITRVDCTDLAILADQDGDGRAELLVAREGGAEVWPGGARAGARPLGGVPAAVVDWATGDVDGDGRGDIIALTKENAVIWFGSSPLPTGELDLHTPVAAIDSPGDVDGDRVGDLVLYDGGYAEERGVAFIVHGARAGGSPRTTTLVGDSVERLFENGSYADLDGDGTMELLRQRWDGVARRTEIEVVSGEGTTLANPIPPDFLGESCDYGHPVRTPGDRRATLVAWCVGELRIWSPGAEVRHLEIPAGSGGARILDTPSGPGVAVLTRTQLQWVPLRAPSFTSARSVPRPPDAPAWSLWGARLPKGGRVRPPTLRVPFRAPPTPASLAGSDGTCVVYTSVAADGTLADFAFGACPAELRPGVEDALTDVAWYPLENVAAPVVYPFHVVYRGASPARAP